jgi:hypothetical protein
MFKVYTDQYPTEAAFRADIADYEAHLAAWVNSGKDQTERKVTDGAIGAPIATDEVLRAHEGEPWVFVEMTQEEEKEQERAAQLDAAEAERIAAMSTPSPNYAAYRKAEYPDIPSQLDKLYDDMDDGIIPGKLGSWFLEIKAIKEKYPKPEGV